MQIAIDDRRWLDLVSGHPDASVFHHPEWTRVLTECYGYEPSTCTLTGTDGALRAGMPLLYVSSRLTGRRTVSLPFTDFCPPLAGSPPERLELLYALEERRRREGWRKVEVRWDVGDSGLVTATETCLRHVTELDRDPDAVFRRLKKARVRSTRQARDAGMTVRRGTSWEDVQTFYRLHLRTRRRQGVPTQPRRFFRLLWERLIARDLGYVLVASSDAVPAAAAVFLRFNGVLTYKYGASNESMWKLRPNNLLFWEAIRLGCEDGDRLLDWGRTDLGNEGLRDFKRGWAADEQRVTYRALGEAGALARPGGGRLLETVIRRSPPWVSRAVGEVLYGHFG
jgi:CelD/BcsL family acetyltransferase involved in cellulose biosynthesis